MVISRFRGMDQGAPGEFRLGMKKPTHPAWTRPITRLSVTAVVQSKVAVWPVCQQAWNKRCRTRYLTRNMQPTVCVASGASPPDSRSICMCVVINEKKK